MLVYTRRIYYRPCCNVVPLLFCAERAVSFVVERGLTHVEVGTAAAVALLELCHACSGRLKDQFDALTAQCLLAINLPHRNAEVAINVLKGAVSHTHSLQLTS